jgi:hypothetical protein
MSSTGSISYCEQDLKDSTMYPETDMMKSKNIATLNPPSNLQLMVCSTDFGMANFTYYH